MDGSLIDTYDARPHLGIYWLRPESALWDCIAAKHIGDALKGAEDIAEIGIGNGFFSFLLLGGRFRPEFDWFYSVNTDGFWSGSDIFDHDAKMDLADFIARAPDVRLSCALDHKQSLLNQAERLGFVDQFIQHDCNEPLPFPRSYRTVFSNMLYWLNDPLAAIGRIADFLPSGGELVTVFPNSGFYRACTSYVSRDPLWTLLNRGRAGHIMWNMDLPEFERRIDADGRFELKAATRYLAPSTLKAWDIGLRPLSVPLIKMANALTPGKRLELKEEWCRTLEPFMEQMLLREAEAGSAEGGYNLVVLSRR